MAHGAESEAASVPQPGRACHVAFQHDFAARAVTVTDGATPVATMTPNSAGVAHVILAVTDNGTPSLTSYRRIILTIQAGR